MRDFARPRYFNPYEAVQYGLIDTVGDGCCLACNALALFIDPIAGRGAWRCVATPGQQALAG